MKALFDVLALDSSLVRPHKSADNLVVSAADLADRVRTGHVAFREGNPDSVVLSVLLTERKFELIS